jgi:DNA gyrase subunit A
VPQDDSPLAQAEAIRAGVVVALGSLRERAHILVALVKAVDQLEAIRALVAGSDTGADAKVSLMDELDVDETQARAILDLQMLRLTVQNRQRLSSEYSEVLEQEAELESLLASHESVQALIGTERGQFLAKYGSPAPD